MHSQKKAAASLRAFASCGHSSSSGAATAAAAAAAVAAVAAAALRHLSCTTHAYLTCFP